MDHLNIYPANGNIPYSSWENYFILYQYWKSDLRFYRQELKFFEHLISKYALWIDNEERLDKVNAILGDLQLHSQECSQIMLLNEQLQKQIHKLMGNHTPYDPEKIIKEQQELELKISEFIKSYRTIKKRVFKLTPEILGSENPDS